MREEQVREELTAYMRWKRSPTYPWAREGAVGDRFDFGAFFYLVLLVLLVFFWVRSILHSIGLMTRPPATPAVRFESHGVVVTATATLAPGGVTESSPLALTYAPALARLLG